VNYLNSNNSLGLLDTLHQQPPSPSALQSFSSHDSMMRPTMLQRTISMYGMSDTSASSYFTDAHSVGSQSQMDPSSPSRTSYTPLQSPMGISHSISGLAIGTPQHQAFDGNTPNRASPFLARNHDQLLSLSGQFHNMAPPPAKRRSTGLTHTLYTTQLRQQR
jgi:hypothetical protein